MIIGGAKSLCLWHLGPTRSSCRRCSLKEYPLGVERLCGLLRSMTRTRQFLCGENLAWKTIPLEKPPWFVWQSVQRADPDQQWSYCRGCNFLCLEKPPFPSLFYFQRGCFKARDTHFGEVTGHGGPRIDLLKLGWKVCMACWVDLGTHKHWIQTADFFSMSTHERQADRVIYLKNIGIPVASLLKKTVADRRWMFLLADKTLKERNQLDITLYSDTPLPSVHLRYVLPPLPAMTTVAGNGVGGLPSPDDLSTAQTATSSSLRTPSGGISHITPMDV